MTAAREPIFWTVAACALIGPALINDAGAATLSSKRGFGDVGASYSNLQATGAGWYYTWGTGAANPGNFNASFYPMFWSAPSQTTINNVKGTNPEYVLGFNEPERSDQANMTVAQAISSWTTISNSFTGTSTKLVSPAVADTGGATGGQQWLASFMSQANTNGLKVDAVAFHWYGVSTPDNPSGAASSFLSRVDSYHNSYGKPVFITEFAIHDWGGIYTDAQIIEANRQFLNIVIPGLESRSYVAGYAWYNWFSDAHLYDSATNQPTVMGYDYIGAVQSGALSDVGGTNLGEHIAYINGGEVTMTGSAGTVKYLQALYDPNVSTNTSVISGTIDWGPSNWTKIQSGATLKKNGTNTISLTTGTVTNNGVLEVAQGVLRLGVPLGGSGSINISSTGGATGSTARIELTGNIAIDDPITFAQRTDPGGSDGIRNVSGNNTLSGPLTITVGGNQARIRSDAGLLTLSGGISTDATSARNLYLQGTGSGVVSGVISNNPSNSAGSINLFKQGAGSWTLSGSSTYTGGTIIDEGTLIAASNTALGTAAVDVGPAGNATTAQLALTSNVTVTNAITFRGRNNNSVGVQNLTGANTLAGTVSLQVGGAVYWIDSAAGTLNLTGTLTSAASGARLVTFRGDGNGVVSGAIQNGSGTVSITKDGAGTWTMSGNNTYTGATAVNFGTLLIGQSSRTSSSLTVADGARAVMTPRTAGVKTLQITTLNLGASGTLDLADNDLVVNSGSFTTIKAAALAGFGATGPGIISSTSDGSQILALFDNALIGAGDWNGGTIGAAAVVGKYTYFGDVNFDGQVTGDDYTIIDSNLNATPPVGLEWLSGDASLDGIVTGDDYTTIDSNLGLGSGNPLSSNSLGGGLTPSALGAAAIPEPATLGIIASGAGLLSARRRRGS